MIDSLAAQPPFNVSDLSVILPVYNEGERVTEVIRALIEKSYYNLEVVVVYDFEEDVTLTHVRPLLREYPQIRLLQNTRGPGVVNAVKVGFESARGRACGVWCAYHVDPTGLLNHMMALIDAGYDLVSANRFRLVGRFARGPTLKRLLSRAGNFLCWITGGSKLGDVTTSIKLYRTSVLRTIPIETEPGGGWALNMELAIKFQLAGYRITEVLLHDEACLLSGISRFDLGMYLPRYLYWLWFAISRNALGLRSVRKAATKTLALDSSVSDGVQRVQSETELAKAADAVGNCQKKVVS